MAHFLDNPLAVSRPFLDFTNRVTAHELNFLTDVSGSKELGFGCVFGNHWTHGQWEPGFIELIELSIEYLELFALAVGWSFGQTMYL